MEAVIPDSLFEELKEQVFETETIVSEEKNWEKQQHDTEEKKKQIVEQQARVKPKLSSREKTRISKISNNIFGGANTHLKKVQEVNRFRDKMRSQSNWHIKENISKVKEMAKDTTWEVFKKAIKTFLIVGSLFLAWKAGVFDKLSFSNIKSTVLKVSKWLAANIPPLIQELPAKLTRLAHNMVRSLQADGGQSILSALGSVLPPLCETFMTRVFPEIMKRFAFWLDMANFAAGVVTWATTGATIGSIIPGVGTAVGAVVGAAIGLVVGFWDLTKKKIEDDNYSKTQTQELAKKTLDKKKGADDIEKNLRSLLQQAENKRKNGEEVSPEAMSEIQNHLAVLQEMREKQSKLTGQLNLYKLYFTAWKGTPKIKSILWTMGIDTSNILESQTIDDTEYIRKVNGVEYSAENPTAIFNAVRRVMESNIRQRTAGTVLEGKEMKDISLMIYNYKNGKEEYLTPEEQTAIKHLLDTVPQGLIFDGIESDDAKGIAAMFNDGFTKNKKADQEAEEAIDELTQRAKDLGYKTQEEIDSEEKRRIEEYKEIMEKRNLVVSFTNPNKDVLEQLFSFMTSTLSPIKDFFLGMGEQFGNMMSEFIESFYFNNKTNTSFTEEDKTFLHSGENKMLNIVNILLPNSDEYRKMFSSLRSIFARANAQFKYNMTESMITGMILDYLIRKGVYTSATTHASGNTTAINQSSPIHAMNTFQVMFGKNLKQVPQKKAEERLSELIIHETKEAIRFKEQQKNDKKSDIKVKEKWIKVAEERKKKLDKSKSTLESWSKTREQSKGQMELEVDRKFNPTYSIITPYSAQIVSNHTSAEISRTFSQTNTESNNGEGAIQTIRE